MSEKPILFSAPMIRALLAGRKSQTRRVAKVVKPQGDFWHVCNAHGGLVGSTDDDVRSDAADYAPYAVGERLWVREAWKTDAAYARVESAIRADERAKVIEECAVVADSFLAKADAKFDGVIKQARRGQKNMELAAATAAGMSHDARRIAAAIRALSNKYQPE